MLPLGLLAAAPRLHGRSVGERAHATAVWAPRNGAQLTKTGDEGDMRSLKLFVNVALTSVVLFNLCLLSGSAVAPHTTRRFRKDLPTCGRRWFHRIPPRDGSSSIMPTCVKSGTSRPQPRRPRSQPSREDVARIQTSVTPVKDHQEALHRLREIEAEWGTTPKYVVMGGWPALQRRQFVPKPHEGAEVGTDHERLVMITTAIAAGATVVRLDGFAPEAASPQVID